MKWLKDLPLDLHMLWVHVKMMMDYVLDDLCEIIKDIFKN